jgi:hypothetical protein
MKKSVYTDDDLERYGNEVLEEVRSFTSDALELAKLRLGFLDKLVILDGATLALSFTISATFRSITPRHGDGGVGYALAVWKLLMLSVGAALIAQWLLTLSTTHLSHSLSAARISLRIRRAAHIAEARDSSTQPTDLLGRLDKANAISSKSHSPMSRMSFLLGVAAQVFTIMAFYWLYRYVKINVN